MVVVAYVKYNNYTYAIISVLHIMRVLQSVQEVVVIKYCKVWQENNVMTETKYQMMDAVLTVK